MTLGKGAERTSLIQRENEQIQGTETSLISSEEERRELFSGAGLGRKSGLVGNGAGSSDTAAPVLFRLPGDLGSFTSDFSTHLHHSSLCL